MKRYVSLGAAMMLGTVIARKSEPTTVEGNIKKIHHRNHEKIVVPEPIVAIDSDIDEDSVKEMPIKKVKGWCVKPSIFEKDGTPDNSLFTSCATDGRRATSPGVASAMDQEVITLSPPKEYEVYPRAF
jgi:hypothetical protein